MIISFLNQKGGAGKTALARAVAVEFSRNNWGVHVADMDTVQKTFFNWAGRRAEAEISPPVEVALYREPRTALKAAENNDLLIVDGKAFADKHILEFAAASNLIVLPVGISTDDLEPTLNLATELVNKGIERSKLLFVVCKVPANGDKEAMSTRSSIQNWGFNVVTGWIPMKTAYSKTMDTGKALTETTYPQLNLKTDSIIQQIVDKATQDNTAEMKERA